MFVVSELGQAMTLRDDKNLMSKQSLLVEMVNNM